MSNPKALARTPEQPFYAVVFTSQRAVGHQGSDPMPARMVELGSSRDCFLGIERVRGVDGCWVAVSYWRDEASISAWKRNAVHQQAQRGGQTSWYADYAVRVSKLEPAFGKS